MADNERARFFELLPFHLNGTLDEADTAFVRDMLERHPELASQLAFHAALREQVRAEAGAALAGVPADVGYARLAGRLALPAAAPPRRSSWARLAEWFTGRDAPSGLRLAQGLAFGLMLGVGMMVAWQQQTSVEPPTMRSVVPAGAALLRVSFKPEARENELRLLLIEARASIVAGPTRLGDYYLRVPAGQLDAARRLLLHSGLVAGADVVADLPEEFQP
jgi:hypothetical protein